MERPLDLEIVEGPLARDVLADVARLYGPFNRKYADLDFCAALFDPPAGRALHAFLSAGGRRVGHYAVVPLAIEREGARSVSGKGEAFVVEREHRGGVVHRAGREPLLAGFAMPLALLDEASRRGMEPLHMVVPPELAPIHRAVGCRPVAVSHRVGTLALRPARSSGPIWRRSALAALALGQRAAHEIASLVAGGGGDAVRRTGAALTPALLERVAAEHGSRGGWGIACDAADLAWLSRAGDLVLVSLGADLADWALGCPRAGDGRVMEVLVWRQRSHSDAAARRLLRGLVAAARGRGCVSLSSSDAAAEGPAERARLAAAERRLFLRRRERRPLVYVRSRDRYYLDPDHLRFSPLFYGIF